MTVSQLLDAPAWPDSPVHTTTGAGNLMTDFNVEATIGPGGAGTHTFVPDTSFQLDKLMIRLAGAPTTGELYLYPEPVGGTNTDGFVNVGFSTSLLNGGAALPFTFFGTATRTLMEFDLTGSDQIFLSAGTKYALDIRNTGTGNMFWMRAGTTPYLNAYLPGNIYARNPAPDGQRFDVSGAGRRDGTLALYVVPEPTAILMAAIGALGLMAATRRRSK
jgi:hypothetical protein